MSTLQFQPQSSAVEAAFWHDLGEKKIEIFKLDDKAKEIVAYYSTGTQEEIPSRLCLGAHALAGDRIPTYNFPSPGLLRNTNTLEDFKELDKNKEFALIAQHIWDDIVSGAAIKKPSLLTRFLLITFADLKKYKYRYWFAFPALNPSVPFKTTSCKKIDEVFSPAQVDSLRKGYEGFRGLPEAIDLHDKGFFLLDYASGSEVTIGKLSDWEKFHKNGEIRVGFADSGALPTNPGWYLRNFLVLLRKQWNVSAVKVFCFRELAGKGDISRTIVIDVDLSEADFSTECPKAVGWEKNSQGKLAPREIDLAPLMDPLRLASTAVDLNLKLMRWRLLPSLNLEKIANTKCLLFGAGTLGCNVARCLLGWGVRNITLVDNGKVSFSNPVRQSLFFYDDCLDGGKPKAPAAAEALKRIFPGANTQGFDLNVPMPGHSVSPSVVEQVKKDVAFIEELIKTHDAVFLLMDTRESRWLPSLLCAYYNKITINTALGFDTYLVMRHGVTPKVPSGPQKSTLPNQSPQHLGCYFCNDVVAPTDSMKDRTLDQQCTVTRPGLSYVASALAVELMVSMTQHPDGAWAPASSAVPTSQAIEHDLGLIPHQVRGFLTHFANMLIVGAQYDKCTACSRIVLDEYKNYGFDFLLKAFDDPSYLEHLTGLAKLHAEAEEVQWGVEADDDDF